MTARELWQLTKDAVVLLTIFAGVIAAFYFAHSMGW